MGDNKYRLEVFPPAESVENGFYKTASQATNDVGGGPYGRFPGLKVATPK